MELHLSVLQSHSWARKSRIPCWGEDCDQGELEQHNGPWHDRTPELLAPYDPFARPTVDRPGTSAAISDHRLRFQPVHPGQSLRQDSPRISRRRVCRPYRRGWTSKGRVQTERDSFLS